MLRLYLAFLLSVASAGATSCYNSSESYPRGTCVRYDGVCSSVVGGWVFVEDLGSAAPSGWTSLEAAVVSDLRLSRRNSGVVQDACMRAIDTFVCSNTFFRCETDPATGEGVPILPCRSACDAFWSVCRQTVELYFHYVLKSENVASSSFITCDGPNDHFDEQPDAVADFFGGRLIPARPSYPAGLYGVKRFPETTYAYRLHDTDALVTRTCYEPKRLDAVLTLDERCAFPLVKSRDVCVLACPFPLYTSAEAMSVIWTFSVIGTAAAIVSLFVLLDSIWVVVEGGYLSRWLEASLPSLFAPRSTPRPSADDEVASPVSPHAPPSPGVYPITTPIHPRASSFVVSRRSKRRLSFATKYAVVGSVIVLIYFAFGPAVAIVQGEKVSCDSDSTFHVDLNDVFNASASDRDVSGTGCRVQRLVPFLLQALFNLILYAMARVYCAVTNTSIPKKLLALRVYCVATPAACVIAASQLDHLSSDLNTAIVHLTRQAAMCFNRFESVGVEFVIIFLPFVVTGVGVVYVSAYVWRYTKAIHDVSKTLTAHSSRQTHNQIAMRALLTRLRVLGISTFVLLIVLMSTTGGVLSLLRAYGDAFSDYFTCHATERPCDDCEAIRHMAETSRPTVALLAIQAGSMSCIALIFGGFFAAQSATRLRREWNEGKLQRRIEEVWYGERVYAEMVSSFAAAGVAGGDGGGEARRTPGVSAVSSIRNMQ